jgi:hypothetical protein
VTIIPPEKLRTNSGPVVNQNTASKKAKVVQFSRGAITQRIIALRKPGEIGLGDTVARIFAKFGGDQFKWISKQLGINCGCNDRQAALNAWFPYQQEPEA